MSTSRTGTRHAHGCQRCHTRYEDACLTPVKDSLCISCRGGRGWQELIDNAAPAECCQKSRLVTREERMSYRLAGSHLWFICKKCARTHPFDPRRRP